MNPDHEIPFKKWSNKREDDIWIMGASRGGGTNKKLCYQPIVMLFLAHSEAQLFRSQTLLT
jgi:hypothetical protein